MSTLPERRVLTELGAALDALRSREQELQTAIQHRYTTSYHSGAGTSSALTHRLQALRRQEAEAGERNRALLQKVEELQDGLAPAGFVVPRAVHLDATRDLFRSKARKLLPAWAKQFELEARMAVQQKREEFEQEKEGELAAARALEAVEQHRRELTDLQRQQDQVAAQLAANVSAREQQEFREAQERAAAAQREASHAGQAAPAHAYPPGASAHAYAQAPLAAQAAPGHAGQAVSPAPPPVLPNSPRVEAALVQSPRNQTALRAHLAASDSPQTQAGATLLPEQTR